MESTLRHFQRCFVLWVSLFAMLVDSQDPCNTANHQSFPQDSLGSRNEVCDPKVTPICDYYLKENWYIIENATIMNQCPIKGNCGVAYPTWMNGGFPRVQDGEVNHTACIKMDGDCCKKNVTLTIKNCTNFFVFYLPPLPACPMAYCFKSNMPCDPPTTTVGTTTSTKGSASTVFKLEFSFVIQAAIYIIFVQVVYFTQLHKFKTDGEIKQYQLEMKSLNASDLHDGHSDSSNTLLIAMCSGILALLLVAAAVLGAWMWGTGRCKRQLVPSTKKQTTVSPESFNVNYSNTPPPAYSEK